jgi:Zn-dependent peptidase ImmA (M78 family)
VSGAPSPETPASLHDRIERFCNDVAGEFLLPAVALHAQTEKPVAGSKESAAEFIRVLSNEWSVSEPMAAYRLNRIGLVETGIYRDLVVDYAARWKHHRQRQREQNRDDGTGPNRHVVIRSRLGNALLEVAWRNLRENTLTQTKAAKLLGVKAGAVEALLRGYEQYRGAMMQSAG